MKTRVIFKTLLFMIFLTIASPSVSFATIPPRHASESNEDYANRLKHRLEEIRATDTKKLSKAEKKALHGEVRAIKKELKAISGGVYLSVGALILIVLLIILLA